MKNNIKKIFSIILVTLVLFAFEVTAIAAPPTTGFHKVNGSATDSGYVTYTSETTIDCSRLTVYGECDSTGTKQVRLTLSYEGVTWGYAFVSLNGVEHDVSEFFNDSEFPAGTYTINVQPLFDAPYEVSTYFYR